MLIIFKFQIIIHIVIQVVMGTDISDGYNPWIFWNPSSVVNFFGKMENAVVAVIYNCLLWKLT